MSYMSLTPTDQMHHQRILVSLNVIMFSPSYVFETELAVQADGVLVPFPHFQKKMDCILALEEVNGVVQELGGKALLSPARVYGKIKQVTLFSYKIKVDVAQH